jgi:hypothetical protein
LSVTVPDSNNSIILWFTISYTFTAGLTAVVFIVCFSFLVVVGAGGVVVVPDTRNADSFSFLFGIGRKKGAKSLMDDAPSSCLGM